MVADVTVAETPQISPGAIIKWPRSELFGRNGWSTSVGGFISRLLCCHATFKVRCWIRRCWLANAGSVPVHTLPQLNLQAVTGWWPSVGDAVQLLLKCTNVWPKKEEDSSLCISPWSSVHPWPSGDRLFSMIQSYEDLIKTTSLSDWLIESVLTASFKVF